MKSRTTILLFVILLCPTMSVIGQQNLIDSGFTNKAEAKNELKNGQRDGKWIEYLTPSKVGLETVITQDTSAPFYCLTIYKNNVPYRIVREFYKNGDLYIVKHYINGEENGMEIQYSPKGERTSEKPFINGKENGIEKVFYPNGKIEFEDFYKDDKEVGTRKEYYESGKLRCEGNVALDGVPDGLTRTYYENGKLRAEFVFSMGEVNGIWKDYYESGALHSETPYTKNAINGIKREYYENGKLKSTTTYNNGVEGETKNYNKKGKEIK